MIFIAGLVSAGRDFSQVRGVALEHLLIPTRNGFAEDAVAGGSSRLELLVEFLQERPIRFPNSESHFFQLHSWNDLWGDVGQRQLGADRLLQLSRLLQRVRFIEERAIN